MTYWDSFYPKFNMHDRSQFAEFVSSQLDLSTGGWLTLDLGCGNGRDALYLSGRGSKVIALDSSPIALKQIWGASPGAIEARAADITSSDFWDNFKTERKQHLGKVMFYARFFLHAIDASSQDRFLAGVLRSAVSGDVLAMEYRTAEDVSEHKVYSDHVRYYIDHARLMERVTRDGWEMLHESKAKNLAPYADEDPWIGRVICRY